MSTGTKAGIGIGVSLLVLLLLAAVTAFILRRRRRTKVTTGESIKGGPAELGGIPEERPAIQEIGTHRPDTFQHEVEGNVPVPMAELSGVKNL